MNKNPTPIDVLLIEDHPGDVRLAQEAFRTLGKPIHLHHAWDGVEALSFLRHEGNQIDAPRPSLILLDLSMPGMCGRETLAMIKRDTDLRAIPVIVLTTSEAEIDVSTCYALGANCYLRKPAQWDEFEGLLRTIDSFWFRKALLPTKVAP
jgi:two-component system, chemotaxis family, response regulator Rcp1